MQAVKNSSITYFCKTTDGLFQTVWTTNNTENAKKYQICFIRKITQLQIDFHVLIPRAA